MRVWLIALTLVAGCRGEAARCPSEAPAAPGGVHPAGRELIYEFLGTWDAEDARAMLDDQWKVPRFEPAHLPPPIAWASDPYDEKYWRFLFLGFRPARSLLGAYLDTRDVRYRDKLLGFLDDFTAHTPCAPDGTKLSKALFDPHTAAFRAMMIVRFYFALGDEVPDELAARLRTHLAGLGAFLASDRGFQERSNHAVTQMAALYLIGVEFPDWPQAAGWRRTALARLHQILELTVDADGAQIEQSPGYHFYELDFLEQIADWAARFDVPVPPDLTARLDAMFAFGAAMIQPDGHLPALGATGGRSKVASAHPTLVEVARDPGFLWMATRGKRGAAPEPASRLFEVAGFAVLRSPIDTPDALAGSAHVVFDVGPYRTNHSDLDALSVHLYGGGRRLLVDAGFYTLERGPWRDYFHGTRGHNTVMVDGADQDDGAARPLGFTTAPGLAAAIGASELYPGVLHLRAAALIGADLLVVVDELRAAFPHRYTQRWHLDDELRAEPRPAGAVGVDAAGVVHLQIVQATPGAPEVIRAQDAPLDGWVVDRYEHELPADVLSFPITAEDARYVTAIAFGRRATLPTTITLTGSLDAGEVLVTSGPDRIALALPGLSLGHD